MQKKRSLSFLLMMLPLKYLSQIFEGSFTIILVDSVLWYLKVSKIFWMRVLDLLHHSPSFL